MKTLSARYVTAFLAVTLFSMANLNGDVTPINAGTPVFRVYLGIHATKGEGMTFDDKHPLLVITSVRNALLAEDGKGVALQLNPSDTQTFSLLARQYPKGFLLFVAEGRVLEAWHVVKPINDGRLGFTYPGHAAAADYLRKRFRLGQSR